ncbi:MAG TPA: radical SAM protein [Fibrobacteria bacterium]|nr:radical SAM protein [Fibrobacteria bacterium]
MENETRRHMHPQSGFGSWYERRRPYLSGHGLWLRGGEWNTVPPARWDDLPLRVLIARMSTYLDTSESFTHPLLYQALADLPGVFPDLAFLPPPRDGDIMARDGVPWLLGTQTKRGPMDFDVIALSNAIVQELVNLPALMERSGLALPARERLQRADLPLILIGGANSLHTSLLDHDDSPVDGIFTGERIEDIQEIMLVCADAKRAGVPKAALLDKLLEVPGFARPGQDKRARKRNNETLDLRKVKAARPVIYKLEGLGQEPVAISRGCPAFCSFCAESFDTKPYRENPVDAVVDNALKLKRDMGLEGIDLFSFNFNFYQDLYPLLEALAKHFSAIGLKSQRFDMIARDPAILDYLRAVGKGSLTFGMEGISARIRRYLQKGLDEPDLWKALGAVLKRPLRELKVFMIATGVEEEEDFREFEVFVRRLPEIMRSAIHRPRVVFSATPLVRFPWTPLEFAPAFPPETYSKVTRRLGHIARMAGFEYRGAADEAENYVSQVLVRADRPGFWAALKRATAETGFRYYREMSAEFMDALRKQLSAGGIGDAESLGGFDLEASRKKPWTRWETGVRREFLHVQYKRARRFVDPGYCLGTVEEEAACLACTACETKEEMDFLTDVRRKHEADAEGFDGRRKSILRSAETLALGVRWTDRVLGLPRKYPALVLASCLMRAEKALTPHFWRYRESWAPGAKETCWVAGDDGLLLDWLPEGLGLLRARLADADFLADVNAGLADWGEVLGEIPLSLKPREEAREWGYAFRSPFPPDIDAYCRARGLRFTLRKSGGLSVFEFSKDSLKKRLLKTLTAESGEGPRGTEWLVRVEAAAKFSAEEFQREAFALPAPEEWVRTAAIAAWLPKAAIAAAPEPAAAVRPR